MSERPPIPTMGPARRQAARHKGTKPDAVTAYLDQLQEQADMTVWCDFCPEWSFSGLVRDAKEAAAKHRKDVHRRRKGAKRGRRKR